MSNNGRASTVRSLNRDDKVRKLGISENFVGKLQEFAFDAFSDSELVKKA